MMNIPVQHKSFSRSSRLHRGTAALLLLCAVLLPSCLFQQATTTVPECPVPEQNCRPGTWSGNDYAGIASHGTPGLEYRVDFVSGINSPENELALAFADAGIAMTSGDISLQKLYGATAVSATSLKPGTQFVFEGLATAGALSARAGLAVLAGVDVDAPTGDADLYRCTVAGTSVKNLQKIGAPVSLPLYWDSHPSLSPRGDVLFFASDRPGGYGGTDLWYTVKNGDSWSTPANCGPEINSACDELTPFVTLDGSRLLFASAGHETVGGYDLFIADIPNDFYQKARTEERISLRTARNIGAPINTTADELFPCAPARYDTLLYFSSNRPAPQQVSMEGKGGFDFYVLHTVKPTGVAAKTDPPTRTTETTPPNRNTEITPPKKDRTSSEPEKRVTVRGRVTESRTHKPVEGASVIAREVQDQTVVDRSKTDSNGRFSLQVPVEREVDISAQGKHLFYDTERVFVEEETNKTVMLRDFSLPGDLSLRINFPTDEYSNPYPHLLDSNGNATTQTWQEALDLLAENLKLYEDHIQRLILVGHTDDVASDAYNRTLGMRRARFVVDELIARGIDASKLQAQSSGEQKLLPRRPNETDDQYRVRCRRVDLQKEMSFILPGGN